MSLLSTLSIARQGLNVAQLGLQVTAQNIANVNSVGYRRQVMVQANLPNGLGVEVRDISRKLDGFAERRLLAIVPQFHKSIAVSRALNDLETLFNDVANRGLDEEFGDFFTSLQDLSSSPNGAAERSTLRSRGDSIGNQFQFLHQQIKEQMESQDLQIDNAVTRANALIKDITEINRKLGTTLQNPLGRNELLNDRDQAIRNLSELLPVTVHEDESGNFSLFVKNSVPLIVGNQSFVLESVPNPTNDLKRDVFMVNQGARFELNERITTGIIGGALEARDKILPDTMKKIDRVAAEFVKFFNAQHRLGTGLDGLSGRNFFKGLEVFSHIGKNNSGGAAISVSSVVDETMLTLDDYEIRFLTATTYERVNLTQGTTTGPLAYTSGSAITFDGISVTISNSPGAPVAGDFFTINTTTNASANVEVSAALAASLNVIAAGFTSGTGDNENALQLADLENRSIAAGGTLSIRELYQSFLVQLGVAANSANLQAEGQETQLSQVKTMVESVSGVNIDEEAVNLMAFQQSFQASARVIQVTDEMLDTLINLIR